jgi:hypothetical protein
VFFGLQVSRLFNAGDLEQLFIFDEKNSLEYAFRRPLQHGDWQSMPLCHVCTLDLPTTLPCRPAS